MRISKLMLAVGLLMALTGCSRRPNLFPPVPLPQMTALTCELTAVHDGSLNPGYKRGKPGSVMKLTITNLNDKAGSAQLIGNIGTADVLFMRQDDQMQFLEQTPSGNLSLLNVYAPPEPEKPLPAAYSRHVLISPANVAISQYAGTCQPKL